MSKQNGRIPDRTREAILAALLSGVSVHEAAKTYGVGKGTVSRYAAAAGLSLERSRTKKAAEAVAEYALTKRLELNNKLFANIERLADEGLDAGQVQGVSMAYAVLTDKRRLEEGEVTERHGHRDELTASLERGRERLRLLHERAGS